MGKADLTSAYAASLPMPMMVDSEIGMPLDLNACGGLWWNEVDSGEHWFSLSDLSKGEAADGREISR